MRIQHNIAALNSYRQLNGNNNALSKNLEKLSSGYKINRAGDDAAGLAISEKMRAQIKGLEAATKNANDAISLVQTAEGALTEVHSMLNRMVYLATQSANGTYDDSVDRNNLQKEVDSLLEEIDRISESTNFNGINLLDGSLGGPKVSNTTGAAGTVAVPGTTAVTPGGGKATVSGKVDGDGGTNSASFKMKFEAITANDVNGDAQTGVAGASMTYQITADTSVTIDVKAGMSAADVAAAVKAKLVEANAGTTGEVSLSSGGVALDFDIAVNNDELTFTAKANTTFTSPADGDVAPTAQAGTAGGTDAQTGTATEATLDFDGLTGADLIGSKITIGSKTYELVDAADTAAVAAATNGIAINKTDDATQLATALKGTIEADLTDYTVTVENNKAGKGTIVKIVENLDQTDNIYKGAELKLEMTGGGKNMQVGDTNDDFNKVKVRVGDMSTAGLELTGLKIDTQTAASESIKKIKDAINTVSSTRGDLGAVQNRLEHTINNLGVTTENITAAESRIRDTDMAEEMMAYTKNNILVQAAQAMLAQANQVPQGVLQLLQ